MVSCRRPEGRRYNDTTERLYVASGFSPTRAPDYAVYNQVVLTFALCQYTSLAMLEYQPNLITRDSQMEKSKFSLKQHKAEFLEIVRKPDHRTLAVWAIDCVERVLPYFEEKYPEDHRPRDAIETLQTWIDTGVFRMAVIRKASLASHAAAREVGEDSPARSAARAAGQAVATAHVPTHSIGGAIYALQAIHRAANPADADAAVAKERDWQYQHLLELEKTRPR
jgi:hypothetical protein